MTLPPDGSAAARRRAQAGISLIVVMAACFASMDTTIKYTGAFVPVLLMLWFRYLFQALAMALWLLRSRRRDGGAGFGVAQPRFQALRGALLLATSAFSFYGVQHLPVAEFTAINMLTPVVVTLLAAWLLREPVSWLRWALVCGGFGGALIVVRPGSGLFGWAVLYPLAGAFTYASFQVLTRRLSASESPYATHFYTGLVGAAILTPLLAASGIDVVGVLSSLPPGRLALLALIGLLGTAGHLCLILALGLAPTATLMPFVYTQIALAAAIAWAVFGHVPDGAALAGMAVLATCGAATAWLNVTAGRRTALPAVALGTGPD